MKQLRFIFFIVSIAFSFNVIGQTVYTTKTGEKYHKSSCQYLKYSKKALTIDKAKTLGYTACRVCKPTKENTEASAGEKSNAITPKAKNATQAKNPSDTQCTGKTKAGNRCKRMTKNMNGSCYQH